MSAATPPIKCAKCNVPIEIWTETDEAQSGRCPSCGLTDDINNINREVKAFVEDHRGGRKSDRSYRFIVDLD